MRWALLVAIFVLAGAGLALVLFDEESDARNALESYADDVTDDGRVSCSRLSERLVAEDQGPDGCAGSFFVLAADPREARARYLLEEAYNGLWNEYAQMSLDDKPLRLETGGLTLEQYARREVRQSLADSRQVDRIDFDGLIISGALARAERLESQAIVLDTEPEPVTLYTRSDSGSVWARSFNVGPVRNDGTSAYLARRPTSSESAPRFTIEAVRELGHCAEGDVRFFSIHGEPYSERVRLRKIDSRWLVDAYGAPRDASCGSE